MSACEVRMTARSGIRIDGQVPATVLQDQAHGQEGEPGVNAGPALWPDRHCGMSFSVGVRGVADRRSPREAPWDA